MQPGEVFVHRNVANVVSPTDHNALAVIQFAVESLKVQHIIVCGHYKCGGVKASLNMDESPMEEPLRTWLAPLCDMCHEHRAELDATGDDEDARWRLACELSVRRQINVLENLPLIQRAWKSGAKLALHGWLYDVETGLLKDMRVTSEMGFE